MQCDMGRYAMWETILITREADYKIVRCNSLKPANFGPTPNTNKPRQSES